MLFCRTCLDHDSIVFSNRVSTFPHAYVYTRIRNIAHSSLSKEFDLFASGNLVCESLPQMSGLFRKPPVCRHRLSRRTGSTYRLQKCTLLARHRWTTACLRTCLPACLPASINNHSFCLRRPPGFSSSSVCRCLFLHVK
jgi:hypothetical protein